MWKPRILTFLTYALTFSIRQSLFRASCCYLILLFIYRYILTSHFPLKWRNSFLNYVVFLLNQWCKNTAHNELGVNKGNNEITELREILQIRVITKLPNSEQSYKGKVKTHNYINRQNQSTTRKLKPVMTLTWYRHF